jgi:putative membrane protein
MRLGSDWRRLHPLSPLLKAGRFVVVATALLADDLATRLDVRPAWAALFLLGALVIGAGAGWWAWKTTGYRVTAEEVELRTGMLFRRDRRVPLARLESIDLARPLFARLFGLAQVRLEAVSDQKSEVRLSYLDRDAAVALRDELRIRMERSAAAAPGVESAGPESLRPIARVPTRDLLVATVVVRTVAAWSVLFVVGVSIFGLFGLGPALAFVLTVGLPCGILPVAIGLAEAERLYGFALSEGGHGLHVTRGLLNEMQQVVPLDRVQAVAVVEPFLWRFFGWARLVVDVAGYRGGSNQDRDKTSVLLPVAPAALVAEVLSRAQPDLRLDQLSYVRAPAAARWRAPVLWRSYSMALDGRHAVIRRGVLRRRTDIVPHRKVQSLRVTQGPWQRSLGLATLHLDTAGTRIRAQAPHREQEEAERLAWASRRAAVG